MELPTINKKRIVSLLKEGKRLDGRGNYEFRNIHIETGISNKAEGSSRVKIGMTDVIVGVKADVQEPYPDHDDEGTMIVGMEFSPAAGERHEIGPPKMDAIEIARVVDRGIRESGFINWKELCIKKGEKVWCINIDIYCINDDGNVLDASALGAIAALKNSRLPVYDKKEESVKFGELTDEGLPLTEHVPYTMTFYKVGEGYLVDPTLEEEDASEARLTFSVSAPKKDKIIHAMQKGGEIPISEVELDVMLDKVEKIYDDNFVKLATN
ncbi:exosome complex protein Rrp42 [Candidatus Pacearchaeota archaeon]|nr:exosome complex protein Rrp42 [Candidatus Pacearchaeota archaeon]